MERWRTATVACVRSLVPLNEGGRLVLLQGKHKSDCSFTPVALNTQTHHQPPHSAHQTTAKTHTHVLTCAWKCAHMNMHIRTNIDTHATVCTDPLRHAQMRAH